MSRTYCVYILASRSRSLYTGVTGNLELRMVEHRQGLVPGFTTRYRIFRLVHFEFFADIHAAIAREKEIKGWRREKKIWLIKHNNPTWEDLAERLPARYKEQKQIPHPRSPKSGDRVRDDNLPPRQLSNSSVPPRAPAVIPNRSTAQSDLTPSPLPASSRASAREGSAFSSALPKPIAKT